jgi:hypothetical protein
MVFQQNLISLFSTIEQIIGTGNSKSKEAAMRVNRLHFKSEIKDLLTISFNFVFRLVDHASSKESFMEEQMAGRTNGIMEEQMAKVTNGIFLGLNINHMGLN